MSLNKAIEHGKEKRKVYRGAKAIDHTCRSHGSCPWCQGNRSHKRKRREPITHERAEFAHEQTGFAHER